jgi:hypothetical protein
MQMLAYCLRLGRRSFLPREDLAEYYHGSGEHLHVLISCMHEAADMNADVLSGRMDTTTLDACTRVLDSFYELDSATLRWGDHALFEWGAFETHPLDLNGIPTWISGLYNRSGAPEMTYTYTDIATAYAWNLYRVVRIVVNGAIANLTQRVRSTWPEEADSRHIDISPASSVLLSLSIEICCSTLFHYTVPIPGKPEILQVQDICGIRTFLLHIPMDTANICLQRIAEKHAAVQPLADWATLMLNFTRRLSDKFTPWVDGKG